MPEPRPLDGVRAVVVNWRDLDHSLAGGSEHYAWEYARAMQEAGARVEFLTARDRHQHASDERDGIPVRRGGSAMTFYPWAAWQLLRRRRRLDVVIDPECGIPTFSPLFVRRRTAVVLLVHHVHQEQFRTYFPRPLSTLGRWLEGWLMPRVYRSVPTYAVSRSTAEEMRELLGWTRPIGILQNGATDRAGESHAGPGTPTRVAVLGRLVPHKRVDAVVRAVVSLKADVPDLRLDVVGRGPEADALAALVAELDAGGYVTLHGYLPDEERDAVLARSGLHVCASDAEGWGQVVIEAAAHGLPTVGRDVPGLRDSIVDGETGWLVEGESGERLPEVLAERIRHAVTVLEDATERERLVAGCRRWASGFTWERMHAEAVTATMAALERRDLPASSTRA